ncbi:hypothetical protein HDU80_002587 [Chytriomyces hyalinus]|nr:hypothetical protein HDU80_002587 [Chytriomyces hyalinus]
MREYGKGSSSRPSPTSIPETGATKESSVVSGAESLRTDEEENSGDFFTTVEHYSQYETAGYAVFKTYKKELLPLKTLSRVSPLPCGHHTSRKNGCSIWSFPAVRVDHVTKEIVLAAKCRSGQKQASIASKKRCEHNRVPSQCKECGGSQICEHNRLRARCKECGGLHICEHNRERSTCKECGGSQICEHNRERSKCKECGGSQICEHNRVRSTCKECGGSQICEHNRVRATCKECGGSQICEHNRVRSTCIDCVSFENATARGWLCKICGTTKTKAGVCTGCFTTLSGTSQMSLEALVLQTVCHFFGEGVRLNKGTFLGGTACKDQLDSACNDERTKGAYPDIPLISTDRVAIELAQYDTLQFGTAVLLPTRVFRFNPHDTATLKFEFSSKLKVLVQQVRNYLNEELEVDAAPVASVQWLFYGQGSNQRPFAEHAAATLRLLPDVDDLNIALDADIAAFSLSDLGSLDAVVNAAVNAKIREIGGHERQCHAINHANDPLKRKRCSAVSMKNSNICSRHHKSQLAGKAVVYYNDDVDSIATVL